MNAFAQINIFTRTVAFDGRIYASIAVEGLISGIKKRTEVKHKWFKWISFISADWIYFHPLKIFVVQLLCLSFPLEWHIRREIYLGTTKTKFRHTHSQYVEFIAIYFPFSGTVSSSWSETNAALCETYSYKHVWWDIKFCIIAILKYESINIEIWATSTSMFAQKRWK